MHKAPGTFIVIDGTDGSGKSSVFSFLSDSLKNSGCSVFETAESTSGPIGQFVRKILRGQRKIEPWAINSFFLGDRIDHQAIIRAALEEGKVVLCDRYFYSGIAYGTVDILAGSGGDEANIRNDLLFLYDQAGLLRPDVALIMSVNADTAMERISARSKKTGEIVKYETTEMIRLIRKQFHWLVDSQKFPEARLINNSGSLQDTFKHVWDLVETVLAKKHSVAPRRERMAA